MKAFRELRSAIVRAGYTNSEFAEKIGMTPPMFSQRMTLHVDWTMPEMYAVLDALGEPDRMLTKYFPRMGASEEFEKRRALKRPGVIHVRDGEMIRERDRERARARGWDVCE